MATKEKSTAVATQQEAGLPAELLQQMQQDAGAGTSQSVDDNIVPFIVLLQDMSPEVKKRDPEYVEGAEVGMLLNKATRQLYAADAKQAEETGLPLLRFQPAAFDRAIIEWIPRNDGGGFIARHEIEGSVEQSMARIGGKQITDPNDPNKKIWRTADGKHDLIDTRYHYGNCLDEDDVPSAAVIGMSSTGHTASREWMTLMNNKKIKVGNALLPLPSFARWYTVRSKPKKNTKGDFFVFAVDDGGPITDAALYHAGKSLHEAFENGNVRADEGAPKTEEDDDNSPV